MFRKIAVLLVLLALMVVACGDDDVTTTEATTTTSTTTSTTVAAATTAEPFGPEDVDAAALYANNCAVCHGDNLSDGVAPDLLASGLDAEGMSVILFSEHAGTVWVEHLSPLEIDAIVLYILQQQG